MIKRDISTQYTWPASTAGLVDHIEIVRQKNGRAVAYMHAQEDTSLHSERNAARAMIRAKGWGTLSDFRNGQYVLRVGGLKDEQQFIEFLDHAGIVAGTPRIDVMHAPQIIEPKTGTWGFIQNHSLTISGIIATVGNALSIASGFARGKEIGQIGQGASFAIADLPLAIAGERDDGRQFNNLLRQMKKYYAKNGIDIPASASIYVETSDAGKSARELTRDYLHRYANQIKCGMEVIAAGFTIHAGKNQQSAWKRYTPYVWGSGFLTSLLVPERKIDEEKYAQAGAMGRFWMKLQSNPLTVGGLLGYSNTVATYASAANERKVSMAPGGNGKRLYQWDFAIPTVMIGANGTYAISKKTVGGDIRNQAMEQDVYSVASQILNKQPESKRAVAFESTVQFLSARPEMRDNKDQIRAQLSATMQKQRQNPWFESVTVPARPHRTEAATQEPATTLVTGEATHVGKGIAPANDAQVGVAANER